MARPPLGEQDAFWAMIVGKLGWTQTDGAVFRDTSGEKIAVRYRAIASSGGSRFTGADLENGVEYLLAVRIRRPLQVEKALLVRLEEARRLQGKGYLSWRNIEACLSARDMTTDLK